MHMLLWATKANLQDFTLGETGMPHKLQLFHLGSRFDNCSYEHLKHLKKRSSALCRRNMLLSSSSTDSARALNHNTVPCIMAVLAFHYNNNTTISPKFPRAEVFGVFKWSCNSTVSDTAVCSPSFCKPGAGSTLQLHCPQETATITCKTARELGLISRRLWLWDWSPVTQTPLPAQHCNPNLQCFLPQLYGSRSLNPEGAAIAGRHFPKFILLPTCASWEFPRA